MEAYHILERVGEGSFGRVYKGRRKYTGQFVALKFMSKAGKSPKELSELRAEIAILRRLDHPHIILMLDCFETADDIVLVTEYAHGELYRILLDDKTLPEAVVRDIAVQLVSALSYLHAHRIVHRDMKPQNVLVGSDGAIKLADFGFARQLSASTVLLTSIKGTPLYLSPEIFTDGKYDGHADIWGLGVMLYELAAGEPPWYASNLHALMKVILSEEAKYPPHFSGGMVSFLSRMLVRDPAKRASWPEIIRHPWIAGAVPLPVPSVAAAAPVAAAVGGSGASTASGATSGAAAAPVAASVATATAVAVAAVAPTHTRAPTTAAGAGMTSAPPPAATTARPGPAGSGGSRAGSAPPSRAPRAGPPHAAGHTVDDYEAAGTAAPGGVAGHSSRAGAGVGSSSRPSDAVGFTGSRPPPADAAVPASRSGAAARPVSVGASAGHRGHHAADGDSGATPRQHLRQAAGDSARGTVHVPTHPVVSPTAADRGRAYRPLVSVPDGFVSRIPVPSPSPAAKRPTTVALDGRR